MFIGITFSLLTGLIWSMIGVIYSKAVEKKDSFFFFMFLQSLTFIIMSWGRGVSLNATWQEVLLVAGIFLPAALAGQGGFLLLSRAMQCGANGVAWGIMQSAMIMPFLTGWLFCGQQIAYLNLIGTGLTLAGIIVLASRKKSSAGEKSVSRQFIVYTLGAFLLTGISQSLTILPGMWHDLSAEALTWRLPLYSCAGLIWGILFLIHRGKASGTSALMALLYGAVVALGQFTLYWAIDRMNLLQRSNVVYPVAIGSCIVFFFFYCGIFRKERHELIETAAIMILIAGVLLLAFPA